MRCGLCARCVWLGRDGACLKDDVAVLAPGGLACSMHVDSGVEMCSRCGAPYRGESCGGLCQVCRSDPVNPAHYRVGGVECIDVIEAWGLGYHLGNAVKYICRAGRKGDAAEDLRKARWYIDREIGRVK